MDKAIRSLFLSAPGIAYLDSATYGLPPEPTVRAMRAALDSWQSGTADWIADWDRPAEAARSSFAHLIGTAPERVSLLPAASVGVGLVAAGLGAGDEVVVPADEFTSVLFPLLLARERGAIVREVDFERLPDEIGPGTTLVATSLVQMQTGRMAELAAILDRAGAVGARVLIDATQAIPFVPLAPVIDRVDYLVAAAYKHLLCPRGVAFLAVAARASGRPAAARRELARGGRTVRALLRGAAHARVGRTATGRVSRLDPLDRCGRVAPAPREVDADRRVRGGARRGP